MKENKNLKRGISLIVLVITIIVIVILAVAVILSIANDNPIERAKEARNKHNEKELEQTANLLFQEWYQKKELNQFSDNDIINEYDIYAQKYVDNKLKNDYNYDDKQISRVSVSTENGVVVRPEIIDARYVTAKDYGNYVTNYTTPCKIESDTTNGIGGWKIFYSNKTNIFLIADDYIYKTYVPKGKLGNEIYAHGDYKLSMDYIIRDYKGTNDILDELKSLNKMYFDNNYTSKDYNVKAVAYMLDTNIWNTNFKNSTFADYAIGGPSIEMFVDSYNQKYNDKKIELQVTSSEGYSLKWKNNNEYAGYIKGLKTTDDTCVVSNDKASGLWISSPNVAGGYNVFWASSDGWLGSRGTGNENPGFRTVICLNSNVKLKKVQDRFELQK